MVGVLEDEGWVGEVGQMRGLGGEGLSFRGLDGMRWEGGIGVGVGIDSKAWNVYCIEMDQAENNLIGESLGCG